MSKQDRKYVENCGSVIEWKKRKKLEQAFNTKTGRLIHPPKSNKS